MEAAHAVRSGDIFKRARGYRETPGGDKSARRAGISRESRRARVGIGRIPRPEAARWGVGGDKFPRAVPFRRHLSRLRPRRLYRLGDCRFRDEIPNFERFRDRILQNPSQFSRGKLFQWVKQDGEVLRSLVWRAPFVVRANVLHHARYVSGRCVFEAVCSSVLLSPRVPISKWLPLHPALICAERSPPASTARSGRMRLVTLRVFRASSTTGPHIWRRHSMPCSGSVLLSAPKRQDPIGFL